MDTWIEKSVSKDVTVLAEVTDEGEETGNFQYWFATGEVTETDGKGYTVNPQPPPAVLVSGSRWRELWVGAAAGALAGGVVGLTAAAIIH